MSRFNHLTNPTNRLVSGFLITKVNKDFKFNSDNISIVFIIVL